MSDRWLIPISHLITEQSKEEKLLNLTAYHEAGHAVMARFLGGRVTWVTLEPEFESGKYGITQVVWPSDWFETKTGCEQAAMVALAGPAAEMIHLGEPFHPATVVEWSEDWRQADEALRSWIKQEPARFVALEHIARLVVNHFYQDSVWAAVAALADELDAHETLEQEAIEEVLNVWME